MFKAPISCLSGSHVCSSTTKDDSSSSTFNCFVSCEVQRRSCNNRRLLRVLPNLHVYGHLG